MTPFVTNIDYNAKGQRDLIEYGNGARTHDLRVRPAHLPPVASEDRPVRPGRMATVSQLFTDPLSRAGPALHLRPGRQHHPHRGRGAQTIINGQQVEPVCAYTYDAIYRLIEATGREHIGQTAFRLQSAESPRPRLPVLRLQPIRTTSGAAQLHRALRV